ncbi:MAG: hypothetical protein OXB98_06575 [Bryobacterales bacterium]|nr:hypothetical protein [Bryobacterales bacterium]
MSTDARWIIGTILPTILTGFALMISFMSAQHAGINARLDALESRLGALEDRTLSIEEHLRSTPSAITTPDSPPKHR